MAHNINSYIGREAAWHALGTVTGKYMSWSDILAAGHLDWSIFKSQLHDGRGKLVDAYGMFRWDKASDPKAENAVFLGAVGKDYTPVHHSKGFDLIDALVASNDGAHYETAGALGDGQRVWGLADLKLSVNVGDDKSNAFLLFCTSHDGSSSVLFRTCMTRVVCQNTLTMALGEKSNGIFRVKHTKNAAGRIQDAQVALSAISADVKSMEDRLQFLAGRKMTRETTEQLFARLFPMKKDAATGEKVDTARRSNIIAEILANYESNDGNAFVEQRGTAYNLLNAITEFTDHQRSTQGTRAESALFGTGDVLKSKALEYVTEMAATLPAARYAQTIYSGGPIPPSSERPSVLDAILAETA